MTPPETAGIHRLPQLTEVTKGDFFQIISEGKLNIHPYPDQSFTIWRNPSTREILGFCTSGYKTRNLDVSRWYLLPGLVPAPLRLTPTP